MFGHDLGLFISVMLFCVAGAYIVGIAMDGLMGDDGFGTSTNTVILMTGGFLGYHLPRYLHFHFINDVTLHAVSIVSGAFVTLAVLAIFKGTLNRLGY
ncbi:hypothetical protein [Oricola sp.]|uniref:hypothetical protein n=1 Tax=Oricola sp. TaxID=1979950 RepID=UPI003BAC8361